MSKKKEPVKNGKHEVTSENVHKKNDIKNKKVNVNTKKENPKKKVKKKRTGLKIFLALVLLIVIGIALFLGYSTLKNGWGIQGVLQTAMGQDKETLANLDPLNVLIMGVSKDIGVELTDTIMIASYNPKEQKATLLSIPRDTFVGTNKNKATSYDKINALYQKSPQKTIDAVNKITGLDIKYYVVIDNNALVELVDTIGGVEFDVPIDMDYDDTSQDLYIHLSKGLQKLNGDQAEQLVRFRKNNNGTTYPAEYGDNDIGRMRTQREFLKAVASQTLQLKNVTKIGNLIDIVKENVTTNITDWDMIKQYIPYVVNFSTSNLETCSLPGAPATYNKLSFFVHDQKETIALIEELFPKEEPEQDEDVTNQTNTTSGQSKGNTATNTSDLASSSESTKKNNDIKIELLNGSGNSKSLTEVTNLLTKEGYNVYRTGTTTVTSKTTIINKSKVLSSVTSNIKSLLGVGSISDSTGTSSNCDITIIIGKDY